MSTKNDGGPAFPTAEWAGGNGMSLRDWFAGQALPTIVTFMIESVRSGVTYPGGDEAQAAASSYAIADALLKAREA